MWHKEGCSNRKQASHCRLSLVFRNHLHLQRAQLQQALADVRGAVEFSERLLGCGSDAEILSAKGVTLRRLSSLADRSQDGLPAALAPDDGSSICFLPREPAGEVEGYPVVGVVSAKTVDVSSCTVEGTGEKLTEKNVWMVWFFTFHCFNALQKKWSFFSSMSNFRSVYKGWNHIKYCHIFSNRKFIVCWHSVSLQQKKIISYFLIIFWSIF